MSKENSEPDWLDSMSQEEKQRNLLTFLALLVFLISSIGYRGLSLIGLISIILSTRKPGHTSFIVFFEHWFKNKLFPELNQKLKVELDQRARRSDASILGSLKDTAQSFLLSKTTGLRADLAWSAFSSSVRPAFRDFYAFRTASVNMGSPDSPAFVVFIGVNESWYLAPHIKLDFDNVSVLRMMENTQ
jgi:hypothetical protein